LEIEDPPTPNKKEDRVLIITIDKTKLNNQYSKQHTIPIEDKEDTELDDIFTDGV